MGFGGGEAVGSGGGGESVGEVLGEGDGDGVGEEDGDGVGEGDALSKAGVGAGVGDGVAPAVQPPRSASDAMPITSLAATVSQRNASCLRDACTPIIARRCRE